MKLRKDIYAPTPSKGTASMRTHTRAHTHFICPYFMHLFDTTYVPYFVLDSGEPVEDKTGQSPILHGAHSSWESGMEQTFNMSGSDKNSKEKQPE